MAVLLGIALAFFLVLAAVGAAAAVVAWIAIKWLFIVCVSAGAVAGALLVEDKIGAILGGIMGFVIAFALLRAFAASEWQPK